MFKQRMTLPSVVTVPDLRGEILPPSTRNSMNWASTNFKGSEE